MIKDYAAYNLWANQQYAEWLQTADKNLFNKEIESSFNTIEKTVAHLFNAENGWLNILKEEDWGEAPSKKLEGNTKEMIVKWLMTSDDFYRFVNSLDNNALKKEYYRKDGSNLGSAEQIILHVFNHATYHRGQIITMGRQLGISNPPRADYIYYIGQPK